MEVFRRLALARTLNQKKKRADMTVEHMITRFSKKATKDLLSVINRSNFVTDWNLSLIWAGFWAFERDE